MILTLVKTPPLRRGWMNAHALIITGDNPWSSLACCKETIM